jgi:hypothetical protein
MNDRIRRIVVPKGRDMEIEQCLLDMVLKGEAETVYSPVWRDLIILIPGQMAILEANEQN